MQIVSDKTEFKLKGASAVAIGKFDGIHAGHYRLIDEILRQKKNGLQSVMMNMKFLAAGEDVSFGKGGKGNRVLLEEMAEENDFTVKIIEKIFDHGKEISSTYVREEILKGNMELASELLSRNYSMEGIVENGMHLGRKMGFPTVNLYPPKEKLMPPYGVYYSDVFYDGCMYHGITNIGVKPTVQQTKRVNAETYLYDFDRDIYGKKIRLELLKFKRPEQKFQDLAGLQKQLRQDVEDGKHWFMG